MKPKRACVVALIAILPACTGRSPLTPSSGFTLSGVVTAASDGAPIAGAVVQVQNYSKAATTNGQGFYSVPNLPAGLLALVVVSKSGYQPKTQEVGILADSRLDLELLNLTQVPGILLESVPPSAASFAVRDCVLSGFPSLCTDDLQIALSVQLDRPIDSGSIQVSLADPHPGCGMFGIVPITLAANTRTTFIVPTIHVLSETGDDGDGSTLPCPFPRSSSGGVTVRINEAAQVQPLMTQTFCCHSYTFTRPE